MHLHDDPATATSGQKVPAAAVWTLGLTQVIGYGTLFYSFTILAPAIAAEFDLPLQWMFGALSVALFLGSLFAPTAGRLADRYGAGHIMTYGSLGAAIALLACAAAPGPITFAIALVALEFAACFVLYATAFVAIVQSGSIGAQRSITHLTLIGGVASSVFWPLTSLLNAQLGWREAFAIFAAINLLICLPIHAWISRIGTVQPVLAKSETAATDTAPAAPPSRTTFLFMLAGFAIEGFVLGAILLHMVPLLNALGLGTAGVIVSTLFGPAQVASRLINMVLGGRLRQTVLAAIAAALLPLGLCMLLSTPNVIGIGIFVVLFGLGSGLISIIGGTLPLEVFGRRAYGASVGWMSAARQFSTSFAPFVFALMMAGLTVPGALAVLASIGVLGCATFLAIHRLAWRRG